MSAGALTLLGIVIGAALAGGASLLLAWRQETKEAQAGVRVLAGILTMAERQIRPLAARATSGDEGSGVAWWLPGTMPSAEPWKPYRQALVNRLPADLMQRLEAAMARLDLLNQVAAFHHARNNDVIARWWTALADTAREDEVSERSQAILDQLAEAAEGDDWIRIAAEDAIKLTEAADEFQELDGKLRSCYLAPKSLARVQAVTHWHWRPAALLLTTGAVIAGALLWASSGISSAERGRAVEGLLAQRFSHEALTACTPHGDESDRFDCVVAFQANGATCPLGDAYASAVRGLISSAAASADTGCGGGDAAVTRMLKYLATTSRRQRCTLFVQVAATAVPKQDRIRAGGNAREPKLGASTNSPASTGSPESGGRFTACA